MNEQQIKAAIQRQDHKAISRVADVLRFKHGYNYERTMQFFEALGANRDDIEDMFYAADSEAE